jgi:predicted SAM-dependent methyltransferase
VIRLIKEKLIRLDIGSGDFPLEDFVSIDLHKDADVVHNIKEPLPYKDGTVDEIYCSHLIEHVWDEEIRDILRDWRRVLKPGGQLTIWTVDFDKLVQYYNRDKYKRDEKLMRYINWRIFNKNEPGEEHKSVYTKEYLSKILNNLGFKRVKYLLPSKDYPFHPRHADINMGVRTWKEGSNTVLEDLE